MISRSKESESSQNAIPEHATIRLFIDIHSTPADPTTPQQQSSPRIASSDLNLKTNAPALIPHISDLNQRNIATEPYTLDLQDKGFIQGLTFKNGQTNAPLCHYFGGLPYAEPPTGYYRWQKPRELAPCFRYGTSVSPGIYDKGTTMCPQLPGGAEMDENCLQCNVYVPIGKPPTGGWPVYFYIRE